MADPPNGLTSLSRFPDHAVLIAEVIAQWNIVEDTCADFFIPSCWTRSIPRKSPHGLHCEFEN
jgi:hypothetical protein